MKTRRIVPVLLMALVLAPASVADVRAQVGKGILDLNAIAEKDLAALPNITPAIAKAFVDKRPFASITDVQAFLTSQGLTAEQTAVLYEKAFVHLNLNTCTVEEILLVPRIARRMRIEFPEYRPWKSFAQFDKEIGKYLTANPGELDRLKQYVFIAMNVNTASDDDLMTIPGMTAKTLADLKKARPYASKAQFETEMGKAAGAKEAARLSRYLVIP